MDFKFYFSRFLRRIYYFLLVLTLCTVTGVSVAVLLPPTYIAQARLLVESEQIPGDLASSTVRIPAHEQLQIIQQRILTRGILLEMANRLEVYSGYVTRRPLNPDEIVKDMRERTVISVPEEGRRLGGTGGAVIVTVSFSADDAQLSANVTNEIVTKVLNENVEMRTGTSSQTLAFFEEDVKRLDKELATVGDRISTFRGENQDSLPDGLDFRRTQFTTTQDSLIESIRDLERLRENRARIVQLYAVTGQVGTGQNAVALSPQEQQLKSLKEQLGAQLLVLAPGNPRIRALENQIAQLSVQIEQSGLREATELAYKGQTAELDSQIKAAEEDIVELEKRLIELQKRIEETPRIAIALDVLQREYSSIQSRYDQAVANRARAQTGDLIETLAKGGRISVIEQAVVPLEPEKPNRPLIAAGGVLSGLIFGICAVVLLEVVTGAIRRPADISLNLGISPFATLPLIRTQGDTRKRRFVITGAFFFVLVAVPSILWVIHIYYLPLDLLFKTVLDRLNLALLSPFLGRLI